MSKLNPICALLVTVGVGCVPTPGDEIAPFVQSDDSKADGSSKRLRQLDRSRLEVDEPSDLTIVGGKLYTVSDRHSKIYEIQPDGDVKDEINVDGSDLEALAWDGGREQFVIAGENSANIWYVDQDGERDDSVELDDADEANSGIEGLAVGRRGHLFVAKEKDPARIFELDREGNEVDRKKIEFADDLSALAWNPEDGRLYALSDQDHALYRLDADFGLDTAWRLPVDHPEGIAFDGDLLYVVSDSEQRIYTFELD